MSAVASIAAAELARVSPATDLAPLAVLLVNRARAATATSPKSLLTGFPNVLGEVMQAEPEKKEESAHPALPVPVPGAPQPVMALASALLPCAVAPSGPGPAPGSDGETDGAPAPETAATPVNGIRPEALPAAAATDQKPPASPLLEPAEDAAWQPPPGSARPAAAGVESKTADARGAEPRTRLRPTQPGAAPEAKTPSVSTVVIVPPTQALGPPLPDRPAVERAPAAIPSETERLRTVSGDPAGRDAMARPEVAGAGPPAPPSGVPESLSPQPEAPTAVENAGAPEPPAMQLAFAARLTRLQQPANETSQPAAAPQTPARPAGPTLLTIATPDLSPVTPIAPGAATGGEAPRGEPVPPGIPIRTARAATSPAPAAKAVEPAAQADGPAPTDAVGVAPHLETPAARHNPVPALAEPHRPATVLPPETAPLQPAARDIRVQVSSEEHRVEVRLSERGGEVRVAVRTPDSQLAGALRDQLPALSARLEQSGFRAETWHPANTQRFDSSGEPVSAPPAPHSHERGTGNREQHEPPHHRAAEPETRTGADSPPQEFSWLFLSLR